MATSSEPEQSTCSTSGPYCHLIVYNVGKRHNIGTLLRCATAFNVKEVHLIGTRKYNTFGSHGADQFVALRYFPTLEDCCKYLKEVESCTIIGIEIDETAVPLHTQPFSGNTAFMLGNEGTGLSSKQLQLCDKLVYIPQFGEGTASLNVAVAASIVLHSFAMWAGYPERARQGQKYVVGDRQTQRTQTRGVVPLSPEELAALRLERETGGQGGDSDEGWREGAEVQSIFD